MELRTGTLIDGKFVLERRIGSGGMGSVWLARHRTLGSPVAIKFLRPDLAKDERALERFAREAQAAATLRTRHVARVQDHGVEGKQAYMVMEALEGEDLHARLKRVGKLSPDVTLQIVRQTARGLHYAHAAGIVHRDLKPANIFIAQVDRDEEVKILDFGIAKLVGVPTVGAATQTGVLLGSPHYMSPEHVRGHWKKVDHRADVWSLGVVTFRCLTGELPFTGGVLGDVLLKIGSDPLPSACALAPDLPAAIDSFFQKALARDVAERFQSTHALADALAQVLGRVDSSSRWSLPDGLSSGERSFPEPPVSAPSFDTETAATAVASSEGTLTDAGSLNVDTNNRPSAPPWRMVAISVGALFAVGVAILGVQVQSTGRHNLRPLAPVLPQIELLAAPDSTSATAGEIPVDLADPSAAITAAVGPGASGAPAGSAVSSSEPSSTPRPSAGPSKGRTPVPNFGY